MRDWCYITKVTRLDCLNFITAEFVSLLDEMASSRTSIARPETLEFCHGAIPETLKVSHKT